MKDNTNLRKEYDILAERQTTTEKQLALARSEINDLEQYGRRSMLEVAGIPRNPEEDTEEIVVDLCKGMNVEVTSEDIEACHRI